MPGFCSSAVLKEHELRAKTADLCRKRGISEATFYNWKSKFGGMDVSEAKRLKQLQDENGIANEQIESANTSLIAASTNYVLHADPGRFNYSSTLPFRRLNWPSCKGDELL